MPTQDYAASVQGVALRVTRLNSVGNLMTGPMDSYTTSSFIRLSFTPEYEEGDEITEKAADGTVCVSFKAPDTLKRVTMEIAICDPDPEFTALVSGGVLLTRQRTPGDQSTTQSVGWASPQVGEDPSRDGVSVEVWSFAVQNGKKAPSNPYFKWVFPYVKVRQSGDRVVENGLLANTFEGFGLGNLGFGIGPDGRWEWPSVTDRPYMFSRDEWAPIGYKGWYAWDSSNPGEGTPILQLTDTSGTNIPGTQGYNPSEPIDFILASETADEEDSDLPTIASVAPDSGPAVGGTRVTITGTNLLGATSVTFDGVEGTNRLVTSDGEVKVTTPPHAAGAADVVVTTEDGSATETDGFTYN